MLNWIKNIKLWKKIVFAVLFLLVIGITVIAVWQWNNIQAIIQTVSNSEVEIAEKLDETKKELQNELEEKYPINIRDFTAEEEKQILKGEISVEEAMERIKKEYNYNYNPTSGDTKNDIKINEIVGNKIIELYSLKAYYLGQLGQIEANVKREYSALPQSQKNINGKKALVSKYMGYATSLLTQCDSQVSALVDELKKELKAHKADTSIIKTIQDAYESEKALKKAYYLKLLGD